MKFLQNYFQDIAHLAPKIQNKYFSEDNTQVKTLFCSSNVILQKSLRIWWSMFCLIF